MAYRSSGATSSPSTVKSPSVASLISRRALMPACGVTGWTLHDLRRTARSLLSRAGKAMAGFPEFTPKELKHGRYTARSRRPQ
jgi:hypothetical protein